MGFCPQGTGETASFALPQSGGTALQDTQYTWDANGNLSNRYDAVANETETFEYDCLDRLTGVSGPYTESYTYNEIGNIMSRNGVSYAYGDNNHKHAVTVIGSMGYVYDANGNMTVRDSQSLAWDIENRLTSVSENGTSTTFIYDGDGNRVKKTEAGVTTVYVNKYYEVNLTSGNATSSYYLGGKLIAQKENAVLRYVHQDHLTSTSLMTDSSGNQIDTTVKYYPYGETRSGSMPTDKKFTGQRLDGTGLYYYNARYYDATIGRFISPDTIIPNPANPQSFNRYTYCLNNPLKYTDPNGHSPYEDIMSLASQQRYNNNISYEDATLAAAIAVDTSAQAIANPGAPLQNQPVLTMEETKIAAAFSTIMVNITPHVAKKLADRGWSESEVKTIMNEYFVKFPAWDKKNNQPATAYSIWDLKAHSWKHAVLNNMTGNTVQISNVNQTFHFDKTTQWWKPNINMARMMRAISSEGGGSWTPVNWDNAMKGWWFKK